MTLEGGHPLEGPGGGWATLGQSCRKLHCPAAGGIPDLPAETSASQFRKRLIHARGPGRPPAPSEPKSARLSGGRGKRRSASPIRLAGGAGMSPGCRLARGTAPPATRAPRLLEPSRPEPGVDWARHHRSWLLSQRTRRPWAQVRFPSTLARTGSVRAKHPLTQNCPPCSRGRLHKGASEGTKGAAGVQSRGPHSPGRSCGSWSGGARLRWPRRSRRR